MKLTIHDCKGSIQFKNDLNNLDEIEEAIEKLESLAVGVNNLLNYIRENYTNELTICKSVLSLIDN